MKFDKAKISDTSVLREIAHESEAHWGYSAKIKDGWELDYFYVARSAIGRGYGKLMWDNLINWCRENGIKKLQWVTSPEAVGFYVRMGADRQEDVRSTIDGRPIPQFTVAL